MKEYSKYFLVVIFVFLILFAFRAGILYIIEINEDDEEPRQESKAKVDLDMDYQYLGIDKDVVGIFYRKDDQEYLEQKTGIQIDHLPSKEIQKLKEGIKISSEEELLTVLESLLSYKED